MITTNTKNRLLALCAVGICDALQDGKIDIEEAEHLLFTPYAMRKTSCCDKRIVEIIHMGTELSDIQSLVPDEYEPTINRIRQLALSCLSSKTLNPDYDEKYWIDLIL